jgi:RNA polymerase sigma factor, sigma-70 family
LVLFAKNNNLFGKRNISKLNDEELLRLFVETEKSDYFGELYNRYIPLLYGVCLKYLSDEDRAQDAVMQLFENLFTKVANYEIKVFRTWLYSVAKNHCLQLLRKESREISVDFSIPVMESDPVLHLLIEEDSKEEELAILNQCVEKLPDKQRISIVSFFMEELSYAEIVEKTGFPLNNVRSFIQNGKRNLKICMEKNRQ